MQGDPAATLTDTVADQFWHGGGTDPTYSASNQILVQYRLALLNRSNQLGPPPLRELSLTELLVRAPFDPRSVPYDRSSRAPVAGMWPGAPP